MNHAEILAIVNTLFKGYDNEAQLMDLMAKLENELPNADICDLIYQDLRRLTPEQIVDEAIRREAEHSRKFLPKPAAY